jgi:extracellular elastinolytic metalloproteinase
MAHRSFFPARLLGGATALGLAVSLTQLPTAGAAPDIASLSAADDFRGLGDSPLGVPDVDVRGVVRATTAQKDAVRALGADVRWNDFGTPASLLPDSGSLGRTTASSPVQAARAWLRAHRIVLGLDAAEVEALELVNNQRLADSKARAVLFRQKFGQLTPATGGMVTVGIADGRVAYVSSSLVKNTSAPRPAELSPVEGWVAAARSVGADVVTSRITDLTDDLPEADPGGWTHLKVGGFAQEQLARIRALAMADGTVRPVVEANVVNVAGATVEAYTVLVDAVDGTVLHRVNKVDQATDSTAFQGAFTPAECGPPHAFEIADDTTKQVLVAASAVNPANDITIKIYGPDQQLLTTGDLGTSPETATISGNPLARGTYTARICPFDSTSAALPPGNYVGTITLSETGTTAPGLPYPPKWRYFPSNPTPTFGADHTPTNSVVGCWVTRVGGESVPDCTEPTGALQNLASRSPWDVIDELSTMTTLGNNASDREAWVSPLTPGGLNQAPVSPTREYTPEFTDAWNNSRCSPSELVPGGNDIELSAANLFVAHNRMHDYSYFLGFTEANYNLQQSNYGNGGLGNDPEIGNVQAGALTGGQPSYLGRDNANQIALQDGVPGITNQYLFQPIAGAFYAPCTDGGLDMGIVGHEYTHAITNRMVGGPDEGLISEHGGAMGESWGDLVAGEYQFSHGYDNGGNPWAVGLYATGNKETAIRDYAIDRNPLTFGEYGFDSTGVEVHADGEIWNATMWRVRQALVAKYDARFPYRDKALQLRCAEGSGAASPLPADKCPGNRRWVQLMFDSFLLQQGSTSMLDARDALIAADQMRFGGANRTELWRAFARSGMGVKARTPDADAGNVTPSFAAPGGNRTVAFRPTLPNGDKVAGRIYLGTYEARATRLADTLPGSKNGHKESITPGTYPAVFKSAETGLTRFTLKVKPGEGVLTRTIDVRTNLAGSHNGATIAEASSGSLNAPLLIDGTEETNWAGVNETANVDEQNPFVTVDLAGSSAKRISRVVVSAMLRPAAPGPTDAVPLAQDDDPDSGSRFTALRRFAIEVCATGCTEPSGWKRVFTSAADAFPAVAPRPTAPDLNFRSFTFDSVPAKQVRLVALENQCTGYAGYAGEQDEDPLNDTDCKTASDRGLSVRAAELEVFDR